MTSDEAKEAMRRKLPIIYNMVLMGDIEYRRITAICLRECKGKLRFVLELLDKNKNSVTIAPMNRCRVKTEETIK